MTKVAEIERIRWAHFREGISIRELSPIRWDVSIVKSTVSERERETFADTKYWLVAGKEYEQV